MTLRKLFRTIRIFLLLILLFFVGMSTWLTKLRTTDWDAPLWGAVYPINGDGSRVVAEYIQTLNEETFEPIEYFMSWEAKRYGLSITNPITIKFAPEVKELPPKPPQDGNILAIMWWSLKMRYWAYQADTYEGPAAHIKMFVVYFKPEVDKRLAHSLGLEKGLLGVVNVFANRRAEAKNNIVITHEILHTVGATDKYDLATHVPIYPDGYAEPDLQPRYPQKEAEIMAGRIPISEDEIEDAKSLKYVTMGKQTAKEINWID